MPASIDTLIPHRPPFRFVDALVHVGESEGELLLDLAPNDARLSAGTLHPLYLLEALAQSAAAYHGAGLSSGAKEQGFLVQIDRAEMRRGARGGERVKLNVLRTHVLGPMVRFTGKALVGDETLASADFTVARAA